METNSEAQNENCH